MVKMGIAMVVGAGVWLGGVLGDLVGVGAGTGLSGEAAGVGKTMGAGGTAEGLGVGEGAAVGGFGAAATPARTPRPPEQGFPSEVLWGL